MAPALQALFGEAGRRAVPVALVVARLGPVLYLAPSFGGRLVPAPIRLGLALGLGVLVAGGGGIPVPAAGPALVAGFLREAALGLALGLAASIPFEAARAGGHVVDVVRGAALTEALVPTGGQMASPVGELLYLALLVTVTAAGGNRLLLGALGESFRVLPPGAAWASGASASLGGHLVSLTAGLVACAVALAAPALVAAVLTDLALGVVGRIAPQLPLFFLGLPVKAALCLGVVALGAAILLGRLDAGALAMPRTLADLARLAGGAR